MTTGINFWDGSIWTFVTTLTILLIAMLAAAMLRRAFPFIRKLMIPSSVLGGFLILFIGFLYNKLTGHHLFDRSLLETLTYHGLGLGFAAMSLRNLDQYNQEYKGDSFRTSLSVVSSYLIQGVAALLITIVLSYVMNSFFASGLLLPMGYGQGPGQAYNWGRNFENTYGFVDGTSFGLTVAAMGFIASSVGGIIYLNRLRRKGIVRSSEEYVEEAITPEQLFGKDEIPMADSIDKFTVQLALVFGTYTLAYLVMRGVNAIIETGVLGNFGTNTLQPLIWGFNFLFATLFGILVKNVFRALQRKGIIKQAYTNTFMQNRIAGFMFDVMVVASIAAINLSAFTHAEFVVPLLTICLVGAVLTYLYLDVFCRRVYPGYRHEAFLSLYGMLTGTASTGVILLREVDPRFDTPAANNLVYQQGWSILFGAPMLLLMGVAPRSMGRAWMTIGIMALMFIVLNFIAFAKRKEKKKK
ncbi:MAG: hypothetical protein J5496_04265 [Lachnospiraceae bacterium]|nr:hypothetical protein [Lachnospiraceae bacterium]